MQIMSTFCWDWSSGHSVKKISYRAKKQTFLDANGLLHIDVLVSSNDLH